jgi:hypothetical protein
VRGLFKVEGGVGFGQGNDMKSPRYLIVFAAIAAVAGLMFVYNSKDWILRSAVVKAVEQATGFKGFSHGQPQGV